MKCVILAAGKGTRLGGETPKVLVLIHGRPLLEYVVDMWRSSVDGFIFILGYKWEVVSRQIPTDSIFVIQESQKGIADAILKAEGALSGDKFVVQLGDCIQKGKWLMPNYPIGLGIGVWQTENLEEIKRNYLVEIKDGYVSKVVEKPNKLTSNYCGMGTYFLDRRIFDYIRKTPVSQLRSEVEITDTIQIMINSGEKVTPVFFEGEYLNVTYPEDIKKAEEILG